ncbi:hypothetical protein DEMA109039_08320 [Deinococcus marmoris]
MKIQYLTRTALLSIAVCAVLASIPAAALPLPQTGAHSGKPVYCDALYASCSRGGPALPTE